MDRDGSNRREIFPTIESPGVEPNKEWGVWSPGSLESSGNYMIAMLYQGNIWLIDTTTGDYWQVTGDGLISRLIWQ
jgi:hypothetical protein